MFAGLACRDHSGESHWQFTDGAPVSGAPRMRAASISKLATALLINQLALDGRLKLDQFVGPMLGWDRDPGITILHLLNHTSGLTDLGGYIFDPPDVLQQVLDNPGTLSRHQPGDFFRYCNLGYILLGCVIERVTEQRFDRLMNETVLRPAGIAGGFNWAGVPVSERKERITMHQRQGSAYVETADGDGADWTADLIWRDGVGRSLDRHRLGFDAAYFSPHAGLRISVPEMARLAWVLGTTEAGRATAQRTWRFDPTAVNGEDCGGLFPEYGRGVTIYRDHPHIPGHLIGHAGHALGFTGGAWFNVETQTAWAYALVGAPDQTEGLEDEVFFPSDELQIMQAF